MSLSISPENQCKIILEMLNEHNNGEKFINMFADIKLLIYRNTFTEVKFKFLQKAKDLRTHFLTEEEIIFPTLLQTNTSDETIIHIQILKKEHNEMERILTKIQGILNNNSLDVTFNHIMIDEIKRIESILLPHYLLETEKIYSFLRNSYTFREDILDKSTQQNKLLKA